MPENLSSDPQGTQKIVDVDIKQPAQSNSTSLNFVDGSFLKDHVQKPTAVPLPIAQPTTAGSTETVEEIRQKMLKEEDDQKNKMTVEDFEDVADFLLDAFDMLAIFFLRWYAIDNTDAPYQIPVDRMKKLKYRLSRLLMRMQTKFPLGFLFILGLVLAYATQFKKARDHRKEVMVSRKKVAPPPPPKPPAAATAPYVPRPTPPPIPAAAVQEAKMAMAEAASQPVEAPKRPRGRPTK